MERCNRRVLLDLDSIKKTNPKKCCLCIPWYLIRRYIQGTRSHAILRRTQTPWHSPTNFDEEEDDPIPANNNVEILEENGNSMVTIGITPSSQESISELKYEEETEFTEKKPEQ